MNRNMFLAWRSDHPNILIQDHKLILEMNDTKTTENNLIQPIFGVSLDCNILTGKD